jgi:hypothetical protein
MTLIRHGNYLVDPENISHVHVNTTTHLVEIFYKNAAVNNYGTGNQFDTKEEVEEFLAVLVPKSKFEWKDTIYLRDKISKVVKIDWENVIVDGSFHEHPPL